VRSFALTHKAKADLRGIAFYTEARWGKEQRNLYIKQFDEVFHLLAKTPLAGKACDYVKDGYRKFPHGSNIIFYKDDGKKKLIIVRILHKSMDVDSRLVGS
jgi:toxin ParE1/3/4